MAYKSISVEITQEHFERSIKGSPREAIKELIWNACDADAQSIEVTFGYAGLPGAETVSDIYVKDDGHGIPVDCIEEYFGKYGLSRKSVAEKSPAGRIYHGKLGQGRYKAMAAGNFVDWLSVFKGEDGNLYSSEVHINAGSRMDIHYSETAGKTDAKHTGTIVHIHGIADDKIGAISKIADPMEFMPDLLTTFAPYLLAYTDITIKYDGATIDPVRQIKKQDEKELVFVEEGKVPVKARVSAITWKQAQFNKLFICGNSGVVYAELDYGPLQKSSTSIYLMGDLFEQMHRENLLAMGRANPAYAYFEDEAKKFAKELIGEQEADNAATEVTRIKEEGVYPYEGEPEDEIRNVQHLWSFIKLEQTEKIAPIFDPNKKIRSTADMPTWFTSKPCCITKTSQISHCVFDSAWEATESYVIEKNPHVTAWAKNDHLGFEILYIFDGVVRKYLPDFLIRLDNGKTLILETKGQETRRDKEKRKALSEWVAAVNSLGEYGEWCNDVSYNIADVEGIIAKYI